MLTSSLALMDFYFFLLPFLVAGPSRRGTAKSRPIHSAAPGSFLAECLASFADVRSFLLLTSQSSTFFSLFSSLHRSFWPLKWMNSAADTWRRSAHKLSSRPPVRLLFRPLFTSSGVCSASRLTRTNRSIFPWNFFLFEFMQMSSRLIQVQSIFIYESIKYSNILDGCHWRTFVACNKVPARSRTPQRFFKKIQEKLIAGRLINRFAWNFYSVWRATRWNYCKNVRFMGLLGAE